MTADPEIFVAENQLATAQKELNDLKQLRSLATGNIRPGENPELVARAISAFIPLPIKYTHSLQSLQSLFYYSLKIQDTKLYNWTSEQIKRLYTASILKAFQDARPPGTNLPTPPETSLTVFRTKIKTMTRRDAAEFLLRKDIPPFFATQIKRYLQFNDDRIKITGEKPDESPLQPGAETLRKSFVNQDSMKSNNPNYPTNLISRMNIKPIVAVPCLIEANAPRAAWPETTQSPVFTQKKFFKTKLALPLELTIKKLNAYKAPQYIIEKVEAMGE
ncbi:hypothetical protein TVAG_183230 [Trichomonas vaginalis G3]|uniref:Uncharacterized protein n=1 Tax=Trichomonas vaginalis (strain ATCC PRA-98 / G3) TaxID=412133 RepID=A2D961_TRIV3|nr:hypothetical protein TVAGG3_0529880 [Trichomonas vaginalis G3]EAY23087.1 hypothetical protein TVAG_183230 [Trichomonas vaginalis G3]KAI5519055.1 hypothetical protein TVAGG3_0529880 [Trichomonas vaginalis G3]|eukprot:XP_001584073.1 hypothetical protein [Trichomonas vaginalis G3]